MTTETGDPLGRGNPTQRLYAETMIGTLIYAVVLAVVAVTTVLGRLGEVVYVRLGRGRTVTS